jgi:glycosyltransferase involved in cell wall biosynthesis
VRVLNLVTNPEARFYKLQVRALEDAGVRCDTLVVPASHDASHAAGSRSTLDYLRFVPEVLREVDDGYDLVHANYGLTAPAALAQRGLPVRVGRPVVLSLWGSDLFGRYGLLSRTCARFCDDVVVMSEEMADALPTDSHVVPHGVDLDRFRPMDRAAAREELRWPDDRAHVLFPYPPEQDVKNYPLAERVVAEAADRLDRPVDLQSVTGVPHDRMPVYFNAADALILPSDSEGSPNAVKEALACNVPVVSTDVGDVRERLDGVAPSVVCEGEGELVDGLVEVLEGESRSNGRAAAREIGLDAMADELVSIYRGVVG